MKTVNQLKKILIWKNLKVKLIFNLELNEKDQNAQNRPKIHSMVAEIQIISQSEGKLESKEPEQHQDPKEKPAEEPTNPEHLKIRKIEGKNFYYKKFGLIIINSISSLLIVLIRGSKGFESILGIQTCSFSDFFSLFLYLIFLVLLNVVGYYVIYSEQKKKKKINYPIIKEEIKWTPKLIVLGGVGSFFIGFIASLIGIGGGLLINPFLMSLNFTPIVSSFTAMYLIMFGKITAAFLHLITGELPYQYNLFTGVFIVLGVLISEKLLAALIKKYGRQSFISIVFLVLAAGSFLLILYTGYDNVKNIIDSGDSVFGFKNYCDL